MTRVSKAPLQHDPRGPSACTCGDPVRCRRAARTRAWTAAHPEYNAAVRRKRYARDPIMFQEKAKRSYIANLSRKRTVAKTSRDEYRAWLGTIKTTAGCVDCGYNTNPQALDFDHREPKHKNFSLAGSLRSRENALAEIAKCDIRCANCHRIKTAGNKDTNGFRRRKYYQLPTIGLPRHAATS